MEPNLDLLSSNLQEIYSFLGNTGNKPPMEANYSGTHIYDSSAGWGRLWRWFYAFIGVFSNCSQEMRNDRLVSALMKTAELFLEKRGLIEIEFKRYSEDLACLSRNEPINTVEHERAREAIRTWHNVAFPFLKLTEEREATVAALFLPPTAMAPSLIEYARTVPNIISGNQAHNAAKHRHLVDLEDISDKIIPVSVLAKMCRLQQDEKSREEIIPKERGEVGDWLGRIDQKRKDIKDEECGRIFHNGIRAMVNELFPNQKEPEIVARLELGLKMIQPKSVTVCETLNSEDPEHFKWRLRLQENSEVRCNDQKITLGARLGEKSDFNDRIATYAVQGNDRMVVLIATNTRKLMMNKILFDNEPLSVNIIDIDRDGAVMLVEKLKPLTEYVWTSTDSLSLVDDRQCGKIVGMLQNWLKNKYIMPNLSPDHWGFNVDGELKSMKVLYPQDFHFSDYEDFIFALSNNNFTVFSQIMGASGLSGFPVANFYNTVMNRAIESEDPINERTLAGEIEGLMKRRQFEDGDKEKIVRRALALYQHVYTLKRNCLSRVFQETQRDPELMKEEVNKIRDLVKTSTKEQLSMEYQKGSSKLWPEQMIIDRVVEKTKIRLKSITAPSILDSLPSLPSLPTLSSLSSLVFGSKD